MAQGTALVRWAAGHHRPELSGLRAMGHLRRPAQALRHVGESNQCRVPVRSLSRRRLSSRPMAELDAAHRRHQARFWRYAATGALRWRRSRDSARRPQRAARKCRPHVDGHRNPVLAALDRGGDRRRRLLGIAGPHPSPRPAHPARQFCVGVVRHHGRSIAARLPDARRCRPAAAAQGRAMVPCQPRTADRQHSRNPGVDGCQAQGRRLAGKARSSAYFRA